MERLARGLAIASFFAFAACNDAPTAPPTPGVPGITIVSRPTRPDTISTPMSAPLALQLRGTDSLPASRALLWLYPPISDTHFACPVASYPCQRSLVEFSEKDSVLFFGSAYGVRADNRGRVVLNLVNGTGSGTKSLVLEMRDSVSGRVLFRDSVSITVLPGRPALTRMFPRDTTLSVGRQLVVSSYVFDRGGALLTDAPILTTSAGATVSGQSVSVADLVDGWIVSRAPGTIPDSGRLRVVPAGRLAGGTCYQCSQLTMVDTDGQNVRTVSLAAPVTRMEWLPDGSELVVAFGGDNPIGPPPTIVRVSSGGVVTPFTTDTLVRYAARPRVIGSGPGARLYVSGRSQPPIGNLWRMRVDGTGLEAVRNARGEHLGGGIEVHPNGRTMTYYITGPPQFYFEDAVTGAYSLVPLIDVFRVSPLEFFHVQDMRWSADGTAIAFAGTYGIGVMNADASNQRAYPAYSASDVSWTTDGKWLLSSVLGGTFLLDPTTFRRIGLPVSLQAPVWRPTQ